MAEKRSAPRTSSNAFFHGLGRERPPEMSHWPEYDYVIVNRDIEESVGLVEAIVTAERLKRTRQVGLADFVNRLRAG